MLIGCKLTQGSINSWILVKLAVFCVIRPSENPQTKKKTFSSLIIDLLHVALPQSRKLGL